MGDKKSRQAAKIDKAKDLVEQCGAKKKKGGDNGSTSTKEDDSNMVSLVIMGEYDGMKHLVRDGSKRLKDSEAPQVAVASTTAKTFPSLVWEIWTARTRLASAGDFTASGTANPSIVRRR